MKKTKVLLFVMASFLHVSVKAWDVDMSRRKTDLQKFRGPASLEADKKDKAWLDGLFQTMEPAQEIVILNTEKGFVPETLKLKRGKTYKIHVVNVNDQAKNTSFVLDAFSEHHGTFFGQQKSFEISPKTDGIFSFICPETAKQGRLIVYPEDSGRKPASE
ncbi:MAG: cupredoxin domain-containing protein [Bdellovibrio sp.]|jgi:hypothetical protein